MAKYFRVLADPSRLRILELLRAEGELPVGEIAERLRDFAARRFQPPRVSPLVRIRPHPAEHRTVFNFIADERVLSLLELGDALLAHNAEHVAACCETEAPP